ncbi:MAG: hypothetical protein U0U46_18820 [Saprospiraceae bacterium]
MKAGLNKTKPVLDYRSDGNHEGLAGFFNADFASLAVGKKRSKGVDSHSLRKSVQLPYLQNRYFYLQAHKRAPARPKKPSSPLQFIVSNRQLA